MKRTCTLILLAFQLLSATAQQVGMYSHAFLKPMAYNPAYTGENGLINAAILSRAQWTGFKGSPQLNMLMLDGNLGNKAGLGLTLSSDRKGISSRMGANISYSYRLKINDDTYFRLGIALGIIDHTIDFSKAQVENAADPVIFSDVEKKTTFDANAGIAFFMKGLQLGISVPQLAGHKINYVDNAGIRSTYEEARHYMGMLKYSFTISKDHGLYITPQAIVRYTPNTPFQYDATLDLEWRDKARIGATWKSDYAIAAHAGFYIHKQLYVGYVYDLILGDLSKYAGTSHELMISFRFGGKQEEKQPPVASAEHVVPDNAISQRLDSLESVVKEDQQKIHEEERKITELNDKLEQQKKAAAANPVQQQVPGTGTTGENSNTNSNSAAVASSNNKAMENGTWVVKNNAGDFKDAKERIPEKGFYVIAGTFVYRDFAESEVKRFVSKGYAACSRLFSGPKQYNYVFLSRPSTKEEALKKVESAKQEGIKDAWILELE